MSNHHHRTLRSVSAAGSSRFSLLLLLILVIASGCKDDTPGDDPDGDRPGDTTAKPAELPDTTGLPPFDAQNAYAMVERQVAIGTREPNSEGATKAIAFYKEELSKYADDVKLQEFTEIGYNGVELKLTNIIASFNPTATTRILLCAHWDSRPRADMDSDPADRDKPILAANDGASGVGVLLEMARIMKANPPSIGVDIVLFDGEDYGDSEVDGLSRYFIGAKYFSENLPKGYRPSFGILLDMVGDKNAEFSKEPKSVEYAPAVVDIVWRAADHLKLSTFKQRIGAEVQDDHIPLNETGKIPTIDIVDNDLVGHRSSDPNRKYWHTSDDTMKNISAETLGQVGRLLTYIIYKVVPAELARAS